MYARGMAKAAGLGTATGSDGTSPWPVPDGGFDRQLTPSRRERNGQPLTVRQVWSMRVLYLSSTLAAIGLLVTGDAFGRILGMSLFGTFAFDVAFARTRRQRKQLFGLLPPV